MLLSVLARRVPFNKLWHIQCRNMNAVPLSFIKISNSDSNLNKNPLLIFHGLFGNKNNWRSLGNQISKRTQRDVYSFDLRNHGESPHVDGHQSDMKAMANDIFMFMESNNFEKADLIGHSLGGRVASQFAFLWPNKVDKLILVDISPLAKTPNIYFLNDDFFLLLENCVQKLPPGAELSKARKEVEKDLNGIIKDKFVVDFFLLNLYKDPKGLIKWRFNTKGLNTFYKNRFINNIEVAQPFSSKSLIIYGLKSDYIELSDFDKIKQVMPGVEFIPIADSGHYLHIEKTNEFLDHVVEFLNRDN